MVLLIFTKIIFYYFIFHVPVCSGMFRVPGFIDAQLRSEIYVRVIRLLIDLYFSNICTGNSMVCSDIWHNYRE